MKPFSAIILSLLSVAIGFFLGGFLLQNIAVGMICCTVITVGACIIHTINKNSQELRKELKDLAQKDE